MALSPACPLAARRQWSSTGSRNASVLPEPVPVVTSVGSGARSRWTAAAKLALDAGTEWAPRVPSPSSPASSRHRSGRASGSAETGRGKSRSPGGSGTSQARPAPASASAKVVDRYCVRFVFSPSAASVGLTACHLPLAPSAAAPENRMRLPVLGHSIRLVERRRVAIRRRVPPDPPSKPGTLRSVLLLVCPWSGGTPRASARWRRSRLLVPVQDRKPGFEHGDETRRCPLPAILPPAHRSLPGPPGARTRFAMASPEFQAGPTSPSGAQARPVQAQDSSLPGGVVQLLPEAA